MDFYNMDYGGGEGYLGLVDAYNPDYSWSDYNYNYPDTVDDYGNWFETVTTPTTSTWSNQQTQNYLQGLFEDWITKYQAEQEAKAAAFDYPTGQELWDTAASQNFVKQIQQALEGQGTLGQSWANLGNIASSLQVGNQYSSNIQSIADFLGTQGTTELQTLKDQIAGIADIGTKEATELTDLAKSLTGETSATIEDLKSIANSVIDASPETREGQLQIAEALASINSHPALQNQYAIAESMANLTGADSMIAQQKAALSALTPTQEAFQQQVTPMVNQMLKELGRSGYGSSSMADQAISEMLGSQWQEYSLARQQAQLEAMQNIFGQELGLSQAQQQAWQNILGQEVEAQQAAAGIYGNVDEQALARQIASMTGLSNAASAELARQMGGADILQNLQNFALQRGALGVDAAQAAEAAALAEKQTSLNAYSNLASQWLAEQQAAGNITGNVAEQQATLEQFLVGIMPQLMSAFQDPYNQMAQYLYGG